TGLALAVLLNRSHWAGPATLLYGLALLAAAVRQRRHPDPRLKRRRGWKLRPRASAKPKGATASRRGWRLRPRA
ncbi:hypothetical protein ACWCQL_14600, partial [Streptomyces sp. NPDC002073]